MRYEFEDCEVSITGQKPDKDRMEMVCSEIWEMWEKKIKGGGNNDKSGTF